MLTRTNAEHNQHARDVRANGLVYVGWGGVERRVQGEPYDLGIGMRVGRRGRPNDFGGWAWYAAMGYVNGYPLSAIVYFLLTRKMGRTVWHYTFMREPGNADNRDMGMWCDPRCKRCAR